MKKKELSGRPEVINHATGGKLLAKLPNLDAFLTTGAYDDGSRRESPTLTLWAVGGQWKLAVKDRAEGLVMWLSAADLEELVQMAELFVLEESAPWRRDDPAAADRGKRIKK